VCEDDGKLYVYVYATEDQDLLPVFELVEETATNIAQYQSYLKRSLGLKPEQFTVISRTEEEIFWRLL